VAVSVARANERYSRANDRISKAADVLTVAFGVQPLPASTRSSAAPALERHALRAEAIATLLEDMVVVVLPERAAGRC
jgi:hypothetical protein